MVMLLQTLAAAPADSRCNRWTWSSVFPPRAALRYGRSACSQARTRVEVRWLLPQPPAAGSVIWRCSTTDLVSTWRRWATSSGPAGRVVTRYSIAVPGSKPGWCAGSWMRIQRRRPWLIWPSWAVTLRGSSRPSWRMPASIEASTFAASASRSGLAAPAAEMREATRHEALTNLAFRDSPVTAVCLYDRAGLPGAVVADAVSTHPAVIKDGKETASAGYLVPPDLPPRCRRALPRPPADAETLAYRDDLRPVRSFVATRAERAGLAPPRISDLVLAASELAGNTLRHTGSGGTVQVWPTRDEIICQVTDTGQITDPLAWHRAPSDELLGATASGWSTRSVISYRPGPARPGPPSGCTCA